jgi:hypothetical protein
MLVVAGAGFARGAATGPTPIRFLFTSDAHYGLHRAQFRGRTDVDAQTVNRALVAAMNDVGRLVGPIDFIVEGGDVSNREEELDGVSVQVASVSWAQFDSDYYGGLRVRTSTGAYAPLYVVPGNHDLSNAIGFVKPLQPPTDSAALLSMFNRMLHPAPIMTSGTFHATSDRVNFSNTIGGVHFVFVGLWPDSIARTWLDRDLAVLPSSMPVVLFTHDPPGVEAKHFRNPNGTHDLNDQDRFENLLADVFEDGTTIDAPALIEQRTLEGFVQRHANIVTYFHGHSNYNEFYDWAGPDHSLSLHTFRVDSPMKGAVSAYDETALSFQLATVAADGSTLTVKECLWNVEAMSTSPIVWGEERTVDLHGRSTAP